MLGAFEHVPEDGGYAEEELELDDPPTVAAELLAEPEDTPGGFRLPGARCCIGAVGVVFFVGTSALIALWSCIAISWSVLI